jgi:hypothetical protein
MNRKPAKQGLEGRHENSLYNKLALQSSGSQSLFRGSLQPVPRGIRGFSYVMATLEFAFLN